MKFTPAQTERFFMGRLKELGITQTELAIRAGFNQADISRYKQQKQRPRIEVIEQFSLALEVDVITLLIGLGSIDTKNAIRPAPVRKSRTKESASFEISSQESSKLIRELIAAQVEEEMDNLLRLRLKSRSIQAELR
jgi:transcriptional regulator with XRE-family HTH domain